MTASDTNPVAWAATIPAVLSALTAVLIAFNWWSPSDAQLGALAGLYTALLATATAWARSKAYSKMTVLKLLNGQNPPPKAVVPIVPPTSGPT